MLSCKIVAVLLLASFSQIKCSVLAPAAYAPAVRYGLVAPQNIRPFAAQVSTFTRGLNIYAAPYAAGVLGGPAIVSRALSPGPPRSPAPVLPAPVAPAPYYPGFAPASVYPAAVPAPFIPAAPVATPAHLLPAPFARSVHAVAPGVAPGYPPHAAQLLG
ncbi:hypothetical protein NQ314_008675 [Rhamnusium bicolor]|uniref:Uncharacterized protein n=1 Tax=Rhamnusium bicolor TaxID=1586634 RepID=A0AAV8Y9Q1_9CUCU|nr:hypothetical protein NQ314_008675 [Rhamnusium bicolor]